MPRSFASPLVILAVFAAPASAVEAPVVEKFLIEGRLADGQAALADRLKAKPDDDEVRFGLGALHFVRAVERLAQSLYKYGAVGPESRLGRQLPLLRLAVPKNPAPAKIRYSDARELLQQLQGDLAIAEATLAGIKDQSVKVPLHFGLIRLDLNGDGTASDEETLWRIYSGLNRGLRLGAEIRPPDAEMFVIGFDYADVVWLRGYCHLLSALCDVGLAYDQQSLFDAVGRHLFDDADAPALPEGLLRDRERRFDDDIADAIAAIHLSHFPLKSPERMKSALGHLQKVIELSRENWKAIQAETDDDHEWVPSSRQTGVIPGVRVQQPMIAGWHDFLNEAEAVLAGKKLVPHWRFNAEHGINLRRVFEEPREFDLVLWAHGAAAARYAERGPVTTGDTWRRLQQMFGGQFIGFAFWFN
jgi:hypothetical protein